MLLAVAFALIAYILCIVVYRLYLTPVRSFPGPRLAALTFWYEFYYDVWLRGKYVWKIEKLHRKYGPIVRINPEELHIDDPSFYDEVYVGPTRKTNKWPWSAKMFGTTMATVGTVDHDIHRQRRTALNPFFSKKSISGIEPSIQAHVIKLYRILVSFKGTGHIVNLSDAFACLSADIISDCAFGETYGLVGSPDFAPEWRKFMMDLSLGTHLMKQFGWAYQLLMATFPWVLTRLHPLSRKLFQLRKRLKNQIEIIRSSVKDNRVSSRTLFHALLNGDLPDAEKSPKRLTDEALTVIGAGTITTAHTLALTVFHVLSRPIVLRKLQHELHKIFTSNTEVTWNILSQSPYFSAVVTEGLRLAFGVSHRLQRVSPDADLVYREWIIPAGTPVSQTQMFILTSEKIFPNPQEFIPERWLPIATLMGLPSASEAKRFFVPFSRGTRSCVGMNLAYAELFITIGTLLRPINAGGQFEMDLFETTQRDFKVEYDWFNPCAALDSRGLRVSIK
ncbi:uncharacterized protein PV09_05530 [Verruconis gallopava]|uniref:Cytochrome P450 n=1 Tax=Verruconis gallopava TaxID=253628 RepID=A0A0D2AVX7_9PEZI|nr:uncharacterized protein PV09_05530 [Verruconis gallopava]KIW03319.1 hypothetical protein PV09_05530 [Verruconis gallopava]